MRVNDLYIVWAIFMPIETDLPLLVDADAALAFPISRKGFETTLRATFRPGMQAEEETVRGIPIGCPASGPRAPQSNDP